MGAAAKVGLLVIVFLGLLMGAYALLGRSVFAPETSTYYANFEDAGGIASGTPVLLAGVKVGTVKEIELKSPKLARMTLVLLKDVTVPEGSTAMLPTSLIGFGDNPVHIVPPERPTTALLQPGSTLQGRRGGALDNILPNTEETMAELTKTMAATRKLLEDQGLKNSVQKLMATSEKTLEKFGDLAGRTELLMAENRLAINQAVASASLAMSDVRRVTTAAAKLAEDPVWRDKARSILAEVEQIAAKADDFMKGLNAYINDPEMKEAIKATAANAAKMSESGTRIAETGEKIALNAEKITSNGITISEKAIELTDKANALADEAREALKKVTGFFDKVPSKGGIKPLELSMDLIRDTRPNRWRTDLEASLGVPGSGTSYHVGMFDAFESNKITAQIGKSLGGESEYRYGIYASKPGVGVDYRVAPKFYFRGDLFDINNPRLDIRARYELRSGVVGWFGVNRLFDENSPMLGIGIRR